jgi:uncharacterized DUF497 family protein
MAKWVPACAGTPYVRAERAATTTMIRVISARAMHRKERRRYEQES